MSTTENNVAAQAGDEPMREAFFAWFAEHGSGHQYKESQDAFCAGYQAATPPDEPEPTEAYWGVAANGARCAFGRYGFAKAWAGKNGTVETVQLRQFTLIEPQFSPRATPAVTESLQVCVKALEFRKERSANDEFALNLARIALAEAPRATADVERVMMECLIALSIGYTQTNDDGDEVCADCDLDHASTEDHSPGCLVLRARAARAQLAAIATTKPGA